MSRQSPMLPRLEEVRALAAAGASWPVLAAAFGVTPNAAYLFCRRHKIKKLRARSGRAPGQPGRGPREPDTETYYVGPPIGADGERQRREREREADDLFGLCMAGREFPSRAVEPVGNMTGRIDAAEGMYGSSLA